MAKFTLSTRYARYEQGNYTLYPPGAPVDLSLEELDIFAPGVAIPYVPDSPSNVEVEVESKKMQNDAPKMTVRTAPRMTFRTTLAQPENKTSKVKADVEGAEEAEEVEEKKGS